MAQRKVRAKEALELSTKFYQYCLSRNKQVCEYAFYKRNLNRATIKEFRIGYAPGEGKMLKKFLNSRGFSEAEMNDAGLLNRFGGDMFRNRLIIPFIDTVGVIGYTARVIDKQQAAASEDALLAHRTSSTARSATPSSLHLTTSQQPSQTQGPKYLNTQETLLFNKSRFVFGLANAKEAIRKNGFVVIVEGNMDVISSHQAGVKEAVATSGTAMTENHLKILSRLTDDIRLAYDGDEAGVKATERAIMLAGDLGINLTVVSDYHGAKDPDELIQRGAELWQEAVKERRPAVEWLLDKYEEKLDLSSAFGKKTYSDLALKLLEYVKDKIERAHYEEVVARRLGVEREDLRGKEADLERKMSEKPKRRLKKAKTEAKTDKLGQIEKNLLAIVVYGGVEAPSEVTVPSDEAELGELELIFDNNYKTWGKSQLKAEVASLTRRLNDEINNNEILKLQEELETVEVGGEEEKEILRKIMELQRRKE